ncbi:MAG: carboxypeptidase-like regulatory domain-containing protein, partial [Fulvivirga sp.]|uniref:DUF4974 domain-containing protein n=1 Tax=Fulvivirga sp. TaxID=1931237 RepID=UPI0032EDEAB4
MKKKLLDVLMQGSKFMFHVFGMQMLFCSILFAHNGAAQNEKTVSVKEVTVSFNMTNATVEEVFLAIEDISDFNFFYDENYLRKDVRINIDDRQRSISDILLNISKEANLKFRQVNDDIYVSEIDKKSKDTKEVIEVILDSIDIRGKVTDENGEPLPGATIQEKGTTNGTITDVEGSFSLNVQDNSTLIVSFVGYQTNEIQVNGRTEIDIQLAPDLSSLEEVVVVGYGIQQKANMTGAVSTVSSNVLMERPTTNATNLLQGRIPGLQVTQSSGQPGKDDAIFQIRGLGSFGASSAPLVLIDGIMGSLSDISPNDIENISVLKDAASASI